MTQHFAQDLIDLSRRGSGAERVAKLRLNHAERRFGLISLPVVFQEGSLIGVVEMPHALPQAILLTLNAWNRASAFLEGDIWDSTCCSDRAQVSFAAIGFVAGHLFKIEMLGGGFHKRRQVRSISRMRRCDFDTCNNVGFDAAHKVL